MESDYTVIRAGMGDCDLCLVFNVNSITCEELVYLQPHACNWTSQTHLMHLGIGDGEDESVI